MPSTPPPPELNVPPELWEAWDMHKAIIKFGDPVLREVAKPIARLDRDIQELIRHMTETMRAAAGLGLAAPQVGRSVRLLIYDAGDGLRVLINPKIVAMHGEQLEPPEGCLSIPGLQGVVRRAQEIRVKAFDERNRPITRKASGLEARVIQHEIDHLDGILFTDRADPDTLEWVWGDDADDPNAAPRE